MKILKLFILSLASFVIWLALAGATLASPITYTFTGTGSGTVKRVPFTNAAYTITVKGDTTAITHPSPEMYLLVATKATIDIAGVGMATVTEGVQIFDNQDVDIESLGFQRQQGALDLLDCTNAAFVTYALATPLGPIISGSGVMSLSQFTNLASTLGPITLSSTGPVTFQAVFGSPPVTWTGDVSIPFQITSVSVDPSGNAKFKKSSSSFTGTMEMYISDTGPQPNTEGCYVKFSGDDGSTICIKQIALISTDIKKSKTDQFLLIGMGTMTIMMEGTPLPGIAYVDSKGTLKKDKSGEVNAISLSGKIGGGRDEVFVLTGNVNTTLTQ